MGHITIEKSACGSKSHHPPEFMERVSEVLSSALFGLASNLY